MTANNSTVDGMGFEEVNQASDTEMISGTNVYGTVISGGQVRFEDVIVNDDISANVMSVDEGQLFSSSYQNGSDVYGMRVRAGSVKTGDDGLGVIEFTDNWNNGTDTYFITITPRDWTLPVASNTSGTGFSISGLRRASGCTAYGPSGTVADWIAVGY